jgi:hypothetical protein
MPFKSLAQEGYLHAHPEKLGKAGLAEWDAATKGHHLPEHVKGSRASGGPIGETGLYKLHAGEYVMPKHKFTHTHIEHHPDGSKTIHHVHKDGPQHDVKHAVPNMDGVHDSLEEHMGEPNKGEAEAMAQPAAPAAPIAPPAVPAAPGAAV